MIKKNRILLIVAIVFLLFIIGRPVVYFTWVLFGSAVESFYNVKVQKLPYEEVPLEKEYTFKGGEKYGLTIEPSFGEKEIKAIVGPGYAINYTGVRFSRRLTIDVKKGNDLILRNTVLVCGSFHPSEEIVLNYPELINPVIEGYRLLESNDFLCIYLRRNYYSDNSGGAINVSGVQENRVALSADKGDTWAELNFRERETQEECLGLTNINIDAIDKVESLSGSDDYIEVYFSNPGGIWKGVRGPRVVKGYKFRKIGNKYEVEDCKKSW